MVSQMKWNETKLNRILIKCACFSINVFKHIIILNMPNAHIRVYEIANVMTLACLQQVQYVYIASIRRLRNRISSLSIAIMLNLLVQSVLNTPIYVDIDFRFKNVHIRIHINTFAFPSEFHLSIHLSSEFN